jgi:hypothetical protein
MISIQSVSLFALYALAEQPWTGTGCGVTGGGDVCQYGLEFVYNPNPHDGTGEKKCCLKGQGSTWDDCKCLPCNIVCDSTQDAQQQAYEKYKAMIFKDIDAKAASESYICTWDAQWPMESQPDDVKPVFKCCASVDANHECACDIPKDADTTKKCYSKWANPDVVECDFGQAETGEYCCLEKGKCKSGETNIEGFTDWGKCWGSSQEECEEKAKLSRPDPFDPKHWEQHSGCVFDVLPKQKLCGKIVDMSAKFPEQECQDARQNHYDNNVGLSAVADTEWMTNRRLRGNGDSKLQFAGYQAMKGPQPYCGLWWIDHPVTQKSALVV